MSLLFWAETKQEEGGREIETKYDCEYCRHYNSDTLDCDDCYLIYNHETEEQKPSNFEPDFAKLVYDDKHNEFVLGKIEGIDNPYNSIVIKTNSISVPQKGIDLTIDISEDVLSKISILEINSYKFVKVENKKD